MKRTVFCLVLFTVSSVLMGSQPFQYGRYWQGLSKEMRENYVNGFKDGVGNALYHIKAKAYLEKDPKNQKELKLAEEALTDLTSIHSDNRVLAEVMTDLYNDPANTYIPTTEILVISQAKLDGKPIDSMLLEQRKLAFETQKPPEGQKKSSGT